jgi:RNA polymerase sigma factor (sigma-70 family)
MPRGNRKFGSDPATTSSLARTYTNNKRPLSLDEEIQLVGLAQSGDGPAFESLLFRHLGYIRKIASEYRNMGLEYEDLVSEGVVGFVQAIRRYSVQRRNRFISYAYWWIRKNILLALSKVTAPCHVPQYQLRKLFTARRAEAALIQDLGRRPTMSELAQHLGTSLNLLANLLKTKTSPQRPFSDQGLSKSSTCGFGELALSGDNHDPQGKWIEKEALENLRKSVKTLPRRESLVLTRRYGLESGKASTLKEIALEMGITKERVRQIETRAICLLRALIGSRKRRNFYYSKPQKYIPS